MSLCYLSLADSVSLSVAVAVSLWATLSVPVYMCLHIAVSVLIYAVCVDIPIDPLMSTSLYVSDKIYTSTLSMHMNAPCTLTCYHCLQLSAHSVPHDTHLLCMF